MTEDASLLTPPALVLPHPSDSDVTPKKYTAAATRVGRPSSSLHLWDAENMALLGTLLFPCLALTKDLANAAAAFSVHAPNGVATPIPVNPSKQSPSHAGTRDQNHECGNDAANSAVTGEVTKGTMSTASVAAPSSSTSTSSEEGTTPPPPLRKPATPVQQQPVAMVKAGTGLRRPALVTALMFLSPYPLLMGTSTGGAAVLWRTSDCVCVQVRRSACR